MPGLIHLIWPFITWFTNGIFAQDQKIIEAEQRAFDEQGEDRNQEKFPAILSLRELLRKKSVPFGAAADEAAPIRLADLPRA